MATQLKYQVQLNSDNEGRDRRCYAVYLGNDKVGIVFDTYPTTVFYMVEISSGKILWTQKDYACFGKVSWPIYDGNISYLALRSGQNRCLGAHDSVTGEQLWLNKLSNSQFQFMVPLVQTKDYVAVCNTQAEKIALVDKITGKIASRVKLKHYLYDYEPNLVAWGEKFIAVAPIKKREKSYVIDLYDPKEPEGFVRTITEAISPDICRHTIVDDFLFYFTSTGDFYKVDLNDGEVKQHEKINSDSYFSRIISREGDQLYCAFAKDEEFYLFTYDLTNGQVKVTPIEIDDEESINYGNVVPICGAEGYLLWEKGIMKYDLAKGGDREKVVLEGFDKVVAGDSLMRHTKDYNENWLVAENHLLTIAEDGQLRCWEI